jgi:hypothetical protein
LRKVERGWGGTFSLALEVEKVVSVPYMELVGGFPAPAFEVCATFTPKRCRGRPASPKWLSKQLISALKRELRADGRWGSPTITKVVGKQKGSSPVKVTVFVPLSKEFVCKVWIDDLRRQRKPGQ